MEWREIKECVGYFVSNTGLIKRKFKGGTEHILKPKKDKGGYLYVNLGMNGKYKSKKVHRLVAQAFIPNPNNLPQVNHKDECKTNNCVDNLEWCDSKYHNYYSGTFLKAIETRKKKVIQYDIYGKKIKIWNSATDAAKNYNVNVDCISGACRGLYKSSCGYVWRYV